MRYRLIDEEKSHHTISRMCRALGVTRAGYHAYKTRPTSRRSLEDAHLKELIEKAFEDSHQTYGAPRIHAELLLAHGISVSRKRVARLMRELDIIGVSRRKTRGRPRRLAPETPAAPDLVKRDFLGHGAQRAVGGRHHLRADLGGVAVPGGGHRRIHQEDRRLVDAGRHLG